MAGFSRRFDVSYVIHFNPRDILIVINGHRYRDAKAKIDSGVIGKPFIVRSQTCDLLDETGFFVRYAAKNGGIFVDCAIHDIDLSLYYFGGVQPKAVWAAGTISHHPELEALKDVDNAIGIVEYWGGRLAYFYCSRTQAHGHDVCTEILGTNGKIMVNVVPRINNVVVADKSGIGHEVQPEYWQRFEDAFATEANEFLSAILNNTEVPVKMEIGLMSLKIGWALQEALLTGDRIQFDRQGNRLTSSKL
jgi:myo-inositol 2-dehydrogenase/D-chiro-inositol 1-dehydrogenase